MIRGALRLALVGAGIGYALDRILAEQAEGRRPRADQSMIVIDAPIERVWASSPTSRASRAGCTR